MEPRRAGDPPRGPAGMVTPNGSAQLRAARQGSELFGRGPEGVRDIEEEMRRLGPRRSAWIVTGKEQELRVALLPDSPEGAAERAAAGRGIDDPARPPAIVGGQVRAVRAAGRRAADAAASLVTCTRAFNAMMRVWAEAAEEYGRDGDAAEAAGAVEAGRFARRPDKGPMFTAMSLDLRLGQHEDRQVKMLVRRSSILSPTHVVEYHAFRARLPNDAEEIDSPKAALNAFECEVRLPDGARVGRGGVRVMARRAVLDTAAYGQLDRLRRLGADVWFEGL